VKIGHGPATVIGRRCGFRLARKAESQETCPGWSKLTLFARKSVADEPRYSREAFLFLWREILGGASAARSEASEFFVRGDFGRRARLRSGRRGGKERWRENRHG
jgi:hypothetical protein